MLQVSISDHVGDGHHLTTMVIVIIVVRVPLVTHGLLRRELFAVFLAWTLHAAKAPSIVIHIAEVVIWVGPSICARLVALLLLAASEALTLEPLFPGVIEMLVFVAQEGGRSHGAQLVQVQVLQEVAASFGRRALRINVGRFHASLEKVELGSHFWRLGDVHHGRWLVMSGRLEEGESSLLRGGGSRIER